LYAETYSEENKQWEICAPDNYRGYGRHFEESPWTITFNNWRRVEEGRASGWLFVWDADTDWLSVAKDNHEALMESDYEDEAVVDVRLMDWDVGRDYSLFHIMAGVRGGWKEENKIDSPRGVPEDCSGEYQYEAEQEEAHSHSYLSADEVLEGIDKNDFSAMYEHAVELKGKANGKGENARFVFFFDN